MWYLQYFCGVCVELPVHLAEREEYKNYFMLATTMTRAVLMETTYFQRIALWGMRFLFQRLSLFPFREKKLLMIAPDQRKNPNLPFPQKLLAGMILVHQQQRCENQKRKMEVWKRMTNIVQTNPRAKRRKKARNLNPDVAKWSAVRLWTCWPLRSQLVRKVQQQQGTNLVREKLAGWQSLQQS